jgi:membrane-associated phospholipid phosphatase
MQYPLTDVAAPVVVRGIAARKPTLADLGLNRMAVRLLLAQVVLAGCLGVLLHRAGLTVVWPTVVPFLAGDAALAGVWIYFWRVPGQAREWIIPETLAALLLLLLVAHILSPGQYAAVALQRPLVDHALASADGALGIDVAALAAWSLAHPRINLLLAVAYYSFVPQLAALIVVLGILLRDRETLWEYVFHFHFCSTITVVAAAVFPAAAAFQYLHFTPSLDMARFVAHFNGLRDGTFAIIRFNDMDGLVSIPSLHAAGALMVMWAVRRHMKFLIPAAVLNVTLIASTVLTGVHYAIDVFAAIAMFAVSVTLWKLQYWFPKASHS